jgi:CRP-like cAMP-binding protein
MSDECIELDKTETTIAARYPAVISESKFERHINGKDVPKTAPSFLPPPLNDPHKFLATIGAGRSTGNYAKNANIFVQGADADTIFYLQEGCVKVTVTSEQGKESTVGVLEAGQFFGDGCLSGQPSRIVTTTALMNCRITAIDRASMIKALEASRGSINVLWII